MPFGPGLPSSQHPILQSKYAAMLVEYLDPLYDNCCQDITLACRVRGHNARLGGKQTDNHLDMNRVTVGVRSVPLEVSFMCRDRCSLLTLEKVLLYGTSVVYKRKKFCL